MAMPYEWQLGWGLLRGAAGPRRNRFIGFIAGVSMLGIALGVAALIVVLSVMNGFRQEVQGRMLQVIAHVEVHSLAGRPPSLPPVPELAASSPLVQVQALLGRDEQLRGALLRGIEPASEGQVVPLVAALPPALRQALQPQARAIVLGAELARQLQVRPGDALAVMVAPEPGRGTVPRQLRFTVAGVFEAGHFEYDSGLGLVHLADALELAGAAQPAAVHLRLKDAGAAPAVAERLRQQLGPDTLVRDWTQANRAWFAAVQQQKRMLGLILVLIVAVAAFNLVSTLVMTVTDKRADIAILRTLGASPASILGVFMVQGALAGLAGTGAGVALGLAVAHHIDVIVPALERLAGMSFLSGNVYLIDRMPSLPLWSDVLPIAAASLALSLLATLYPAWRASRVQPAQALRHE